MYCQSCLMRLTKERKIYVMLMGVAAAGLGAVFFISGPGAAVTEAAAAAVEPESKATTKPSEAKSAETESGGDLLSLASKLKSFETSHKIASAADAFKPSAIWAAARPRPEAAVATAA